MEIALSPENQMGLIKENRKMSNADVKTPHASDHDLSIAKRSA